MKIVVLDGKGLNPGDNPWEPIEALGELVVYDSTQPHETVERSLDADIILTNKVVLNCDVLCSLQKLQCIVVTATGYNVVDTEFASQRGIPVCNVPLYSTESVAQHVFALLLSYIHAPERHAAAVREGRWQASGQFSFSLSSIKELTGRTFGVIGWGRIGQAAGNIAHAFGMKVLAASRRRKRKPRWKGFAWADVDEVFRQADVVSLHCPLTDATANLVNGERLWQMKHEAILINTARGSLVNEYELADALNAGRIQAALLDVVSQEPMPDDHVLRYVENCLITPHIAWTSLEARQRLMQACAENITAFIRGKPINVVNEIAK